MPSKTSNSQHAKKQRAHFEQLEKALESDAFSPNVYSMEELETWLWHHFELAASDEDLLGTEVDMSAENVWRTTAFDCFAICRTALAKQAVWEAIAQVSMLPTPHQESFIRGASLFLHANKDWMPPTLLHTPFASFAGMFEEGDYDLPVMLVAAQRMAHGQQEATQHIERWLGTLHLEPHRFPQDQWRAVHQNRIVNYVDGQLGRNLTLWAAVVVPYCQQYPSSMLSDKHSFVYLPLYPTGSEIELLISRLPSLTHQNQVYANVMNMKHSPTFRFNFWSEALPSGLADDVRDLRLYLALGQVTGPNSTRLARIVDGSLVAMLESLDTFDDASMNQVMRDTLLARWLNTSTMELPTGDWYSASLANE